MRNRQFLYPLFLVLALLPVLLLRDYTPSNELRYLSIVDEALRNGNFWTFTNQGEPYADKPPLYFWLLMGSKLLLGQHAMWLLSLFSILPALGIAAVMDRWVREEADETVRRTGWLMLMSCGLFLGLGVILRMDMLMCLFIVLALRTFYRMCRRQGSERWNGVLFPLYLFLALFSKGPVGILVPLLSTVVFLLLTGRIKTWARYWGWKTWGVLLLLCGVWFGGVFLEAGPTYLDNLLFNQTVNRAVNSFHHDAPFYYYFTSVWYSLAPWSLLLIGVLVAAVRRRLIQTELERFFATILVVTLVMLSCISSKIAVYLAPAFPFFVYLPVLLLARFRWNPWLALTVAIPAGVFALAAPALWGLGLLPDTAFLGQPLFYAAAVLLSASGVMALGVLYRRRVLTQAINTLAIGLFLALFVGGWALPSINAQLGFADVCGQARSLLEQRGASGYITHGIRRPEAMDVFLHQDVEIVEEEDMQAQDYRGKVLILTQRAVKQSEWVRALIAGKEQQAVGPYLIVVL